MSGVPGSCPWGSLSPEQQEYFGLLKDVSEQETTFIEGALGFMEQFERVGVSRPYWGVPRLLHTALFGFDPRPLPKVLPLPPKNYALAGVVAVAQPFGRKPLDGGQVGLRIKGVGEETARLVMIDRPRPISELGIPDDRKLESLTNTAKDRGRIAGFVSAVLAQISAT